MSSVGQMEKKTQQRVVRLLQEELGYAHLGNWAERENNRNIEPALLRSWLQARGVDETLIARALHRLDQAAGDTSRSLYDRNRAVYDLLRYGVKVKADVGETAQTVWLVDWEKPENNHFALAEEVAIPAADAKAHGKRPDIVLYVNGMALGVLELKRSTVSVAAGIRQNLDNQRKVFIQPFFSTMQLVMAGNDTEGLRYATIETPEKYYLTWKESDRDGAPTSEANPLDRALVQLCAKPRFLEFIHDFVLFDAGVKKLCRHNQYFAVRAAQEFIRRREGGIIWNTQGSGKSLIMVWLARWIREHVTDARVLIITDRKELDEQIERVFKGVNEDIYRTESGADLIARLNAATPWLQIDLALVALVTAGDEAVGGGGANERGRGKTPGPWLEGLSELSARLLDDASEQRVSRRAQRVRAGRARDVGPRPVHGGRRLERAAARPAQGDGAVLVQADGDFDVVGRQLGFGHGARAVGRERTGLGAVDQGAGAVVVYGEPLAVGPAVAFEPEQAHVVDAGLLDLEPEHDVRSALAVVGDPQREVFLLLECGALDTGGDLEPVIAVDHHGLETGGGELDERLAFGGDIVGRRVR